MVDTETRTTLVGSLYEGPLLCPAVIRPGMNDDLESSEDRQKSELPPSRTLYELSYSISSVMDGTCHQKNVWRIP